MFSLHPKNGNSATECERGPEVAKRIPGTYALVDITLAPTVAKAPETPKLPKAGREPRAQTQSFEFALNRRKLRVVRRREGHYLLRTNLTANIANASARKFALHPKWNAPMYWAAFVLYGVCGRNKLFNNG